MKAMRTLRTRTHVLIALLVMGLLICGFVGAAQADESDRTANDAQSNHYNVVFVTDTSGSMASTDPENLRFDAISRFVALLADEGNKVGVDVFSTGSAYEQGLTDLNSASAKTDFVNKIRQVPAKGWTNIGLGLQKAVGMLDSGKDPNNPSMIILLTDGNTELGTEDETQQSLDAKAQAIEAARSKGYKVYTISLNADGGANSQELSQIASATGGQFKEVTKSADLMDVFDLYYQLVFPTQSDKGKDIVIPDSGQVEGTFDVAEVGVEEANVLITGKPTDYALTNPNGETLDKNALASSTFASDAFVSIKVAKPADGTWKYRINGVPGEHVRIDIVRNTDLSAQLEVADADGGKNDEYTAGMEPTLAVKLAEGGKEVQGDALAGFQGNFELANAKGGSESIAMKAENGAISAKVPLKNKGTYTAKATIKGHGYEMTTNALTFNVGNSAPKKVKDLETTVKIWPFIDNKAEIDLSEGATDQQDKTLSYSVDSSAFQKNDYSINGSKLTVNNFSLSQGSFTIRATDSEGASTTFNVLVKTVNIGLITLIAIGAGVLVALIVAGILLYIALNKRFNGTLFVREFNYDEGNEYKDEVERRRGRGRIKLMAFNVNTYGIDPRKSYIQASGKDYVTLVTKTPVFANGEMTKKVRIPGNGYAVTVSPDKNATKGLQIRFQSSKVRTGF